MLKHIIPSKTRIKILELFFHHSSQTYYLRQVVREVNEEVNAVKRELDILEKTKVLLKERRLNKVFYTLNKHYILYEEFLKIFSKSVALSRNIMNNMPKLGKIKYAALSTKFTRGIAIRDDEIYLMLVGTIVVPEVAAIVAEAEKEFGRDINYTIMTDDEYLFRKRNNDPFIWKFLRSPKVMLAGSEEDFLK